MSTRPTDSEPASAVYVGSVHHARHRPRAHRFTYRVFELLLDLEELDDVFKGAWLWSVERPNLGAFRRRDFLGPIDRPLREAVRDRVAKESGELPPEGPIRLLTQVALFGYCFNPVSFYYLFEADGTTLHSIVAEITNTPWNERYQYVLLASEATLEGEWYEWRFDKDFHVSPFFDMDHRYHWRFTVPGPGLGSPLRVAMENRTGPEDERVFDVAFELERRRLDPSQLRKSLLRHPWISAKILGAIYWQALRLWTKRTPFFSHPKSA